jgi:hypothetical protein
VGGTQVVKKRAAVCNHTQLYTYHACLVARAVTARAGLAGLLLLVCALCMHWARLNERRRGVLGEDGGGVRLKGGGGLVEGVLGCA